MGGAFVVFDPFGRLRCAQPRRYRAPVDEYIAEQHRDLVAAYRAAEADTETTLWPDRPDAINRIKTFDTRPREEQQ